MHGKKSHVFGVCESCKQFQLHVFVIVSLLKRPASYEIECWNVFTVSVRISISIVSSLTICPAEQIHYYSRIIMIHFFGNLLLPLWRNKATPLTLLNSSTDMSWNGCHVFWRQFIWLNVVFLCRKFVSTLNQISRNRN